MTFHWAVVVANGVAANLSLIPGEEFFKQKRFFRKFSASAQAKQSYQGFHEKFASNATSSYLCKMYNVNLVFFSISVLNVSLLEPGNRRHQ